jgi:hypothetical protein
MRGGARLGAGRPRGSLNKSTRKLRAEAIAIAQTEPTPLHVMLLAMRHHLGTAEGEKRKGNRANLKLINAAFNAAVDAAKAAAPFLHPRIAAVETKAQPIDLRKLSDEDLESLIGIVERASIPQLESFSANGDNWQE